jgi:hypothetical protein
MTALKDYRQFGGRHWETGSVHNILAYQGVNGPHNDQPLSEALLLGISGGITFGYFLFHYEGQDPQLALLTRNTFDPLQTLLERLGVVQDVRHTASAEQGQTNLMDVLENGQPALVWADSYMLPYNQSAVPSEQMWAMQPLVVYGYDGETAYIADRSSQPLQVDAELFLQARGRIKKDKFRVVALDLPGTDKLPAAVSAGIWDCINLFTEKPPHGSKTNFGLAAFAHWVEMLTNTRNKQSWARFFPPGAGMVSALLGNAYSPGLHGWVHSYGGARQADRSRYADFLDEAALILAKPALGESASRFRESAAAWDALLDIALPANVPLLAKGRRLQAETARLFVEVGQAASDEIQALNAEFQQVRSQGREQFPLDGVQAAELRAAMAEQVLAIRDIEVAAIDSLKAAMSLPSGS